MCWISFAGIVLTMQRLSDQRSRVKLKRMLIATEVLAALVKEDRKGISCSRIGLTEPVSNNLEI